MSFPMRCRVTAQAASTRIDIYDDIGEGGWFAEGLSAKAFAAQMNPLTGPLDVHINSYGGDVADGIAIANTIRNHKGPKTTVVDGFACSIASVILQAGDQRIVEPGSMTMIHDASAGCSGNASDMRDTADWLDKNSDNLADIYASRAGGTAQQWRATMRKDTWYTADEAVAAGLADKVGSGSAVLPVGVDVTAFATVPGRIAAQMRALPFAAAPVTDAARHDPMTGTHSHPHPAYGSQGGDSMHSHEHTHDSDAAHSHSHSEPEPDTGSGDGDAADKITVTFTAGSAGILDDAFMGWLTAEVKARGAEAAAAEQSCEDMGHQCCKDAAAHASGPQNAPGKPYKPVPYRREASETVQCPSCSKFNDVDAAYCDQCGVKLTGRSDVEETTGAGKGAGTDDGPPADHSEALTAEAVRALLVDEGLLPDADGFLRRHASGAAAEVDNSDWDASKAWSAGADSDDPAAFYAGICAGEKAGDKSTQGAWALPYKYSPSSPPNAAGVKNALSRLPQTEGLTNAAQAKSTLQAAMKKVNPDYEPDDSAQPDLSGIDPAELRAALKGAVAWKAR
jgi:ATP-dependent protease ClpP protease subunit